MKAAHECRPLARGLLRHTPCGPAQGTRRNSRETPSVTPRALPSNLKRREGVRACERAAGAAPGLGSRARLLRLRLQRRSFTYPAGAGLQRRTSPGAGGGGSPGSGPTTPLPPPSSFRGAPGGALFPRRSPALAAGPRPLRPALAPPPGPSGQGSTAPLSCVSAAVSTSDRAPETPSWAPWPRSW